MNFDTISTGRSTSSVCHNNIHAKEMQEMEQLESDCRCSKVEQDTLNNIELRQINQNNDTGVLIASEEEIEILRKGHQKCYVIRKNYLFPNNTTNRTCNQGRSSDSDCPTNEHVQEKKGMKPVASCSKKAQKSINNKLSRQIKQFDASDGVHCVPMETFKIVRAAHRQRLAHQQNYYIIDNDTGNERIYPK